MIDVWYCTGRAWIRAALNEHTLERYVQEILSERSSLQLDSTAVIRSALSIVVLCRTVRNHYEPHAFLLDIERSSMLPQMAAGRCLRCCQLAVSS